jgi:AcrR family transcriptional regulator
MRTHEDGVGSDARPAATAGEHPAGRVPAQPAAPAGHVRVAPAALAWDCAVDADPDAGGPDPHHHDAGCPDAAPAPGQPRRPGRPRSERAEQAILEAAIAAVTEVGIEGVRCDDVAARAGVGKATLYRRWPGKEDLLIAAFASMRHPLPEPRGVSVRDDLIALLTVVAADADDPRSAQQYALLHGAGERYPRLVARYRDEVVEPRRELVRTVLRRGVAAGELLPGTDVEVAMLLLTGAVMARGKHDPTPTAPGFVRSAVDQLLGGIAAR